MAARFNGLSGVWWRVWIRWFPTLCPSFVSATGTQWASDAATAITNGWNGANKIRVLNPILLDSNGNKIENNQSMLYMIPEAGTMAMWSIFSLLGLAGYRRMKR